MKRLLLVLLCLVVCGCAEPWTEEAAREEAFRNVEMKIDVSRYPAVDPNFEENLQAMNTGKRKVANRFITKEPPGSYFGYIVSELDKKGNQKSTLFCDNEGNVMCLRIFSGDKFPKAAYMYAMQDGYDSGKKIFNAGELTSLSLDTSPRERFVFNADGSLQGRLRR